jgi:hypothetical protein
MLLRKAESWTSLGAEDPLEVMRCEVHDEEDGFKGVGITSDDQIEKLGSELVILHLCQLMHNLNFPHHLLGGVVVLEDVGDHFDGHYLTTFAALGFDYLAERSFADEGYDFVLGFQLFPFV